MTDLIERIRALAEEHSFSGAIGVHRNGELEVAEAFGLAHRSYGVPNRSDTRFAAASAAKSFTSLTVMSLVADGVLSLDTTARSLLGSDLPLIDDSVTVEHLLSHRSGIGDYIDEDLDLPITQYCLARPVQDLITAEDYLGVLDGFPMQFAPGEQFKYCNGGFVVLALLIERAAATPYHQLVDERVFGPAGMVDTAFDRADSLPPNTATGYLPLEGEERTNVFHLPMIGCGDGGAYTTVADIGRCWQATFSGRIVPLDRVAQIIEPRSEHEGVQYGFGFWLRRATGVVQMEGYDAGVSFRSLHHPERNETLTVVSNSSEGTWPVVRALSTDLGL